MKLLRSICVLSACVALAAPVVAQDIPAKITLKDNRVILWSEITPTGANLGWKVKDAASGQDRIINIPATDVVRVYFPEPADLIAATVALQQGKADEALAKVESVVKQFQIFKTTPGTWWVAAALVKLEALGLKQSEAEFDKLKSDLASMNLSIKDKMSLTLIDSILDYQKGIVGPAGDKVSRLISEGGTDDAGVLAKAHLLLGDIKFKSQDFGAALEAYLSVPVFYGSQSAYLANAELGAARTLFKLKRLEDAASYLKGVVDRYPGTPQAAAAKEEQKAVQHALGESGAGLRQEEDAADSSEEKKEEENK